MNALHLVIVMMVCFVISSGCPSDETRSGKSGSEKQNEKKSPGWAITFERIGGVAGFMDRIELTSDGKGQYFKGREKKVDFEIKSESMDRLEWVVERKDLPGIVGEYKGGGKVADDIAFKLKIVIGDQVLSFKWETQARHPAVLDEIRPIFDQILSDAITLSKSG